LNAGRRSRGSLCFHAPLIYPLLAGRRIEFAGGAQVQQVAMARGLRARGFEISMVSYDFGQPALEVRDGISIRRSLRIEDGLPGLRFLYPRLWKTLRALARADAEVYYTRGQGLWCGVTCELAHARGASYVMGIAHDLDVRRPLSRIVGPRDRWAHRRALRRADVVISQSEPQREWLRNDFGRGSEIVPNLIEIPERPDDPAAGRLVVWLATYAASKRPGWFVELARRLPEHRFVMAGTLLPPPNPRDEWEACRSAAGRLPNLEVRGFVSREDLDAFYRDAALFVHTSPAEGVPNAVLEAWARGLPTVSGVDVEGAVAAHELGSVATDLDAMEAAVRRWMGDPAARAAAGTRAREHVRERYDAERGLERLAGILDREVAKVRAGRGVRPPR
jgi:glycosyltransferase involved in cell wall biosynthesis